MKKALSVFLAVWMLLCILPIAGHAEDVTVSVAFSNDLRGSAAGVYGMTVGKSGKYALCWGDAEGKELTVTLNGKTLSYTPLYEFDAKSAGTQTFSPQSFTAIPYGAKKLLLCQGTQTLASFDLPEDKLLEKEQNYAYGMLSDLHFNTYEDAAGKDESIGAVDAALDFFKSVGVQNVFATGDISTNADEPAYQHFSDCVKRSGLTVLACGGNHEVVSGYEKMYGENGLFYKYVNTGVYDKTLEGVLEIAPDGHDFVYGIPGTNDVFIAICQKRWDSKLETMKPLVEPETITWFEEMLNKYADKKCHLLMHTFLSDDDYDHVDGEGDISNKAGYGYAYYWNIYSEEDARLRSIIDSHENLIWFNGHSHWIIEMQKYNQNLNIYDYEGTTATLIHVPSVTAPRTISDTETSYHSNVGKLSEGLLMFSCDGYEIENAINFKTGKIYAYGTFIVYDREDKTERGAAGENTEWLFDRQLSTLRVTGSGAADLSGAPYAAHKDAVTSVYISRGVESIGKDAFSALPALKRVEIKEGLKTIGEGAFSGCSQVATVILPESLEKVGKDAFGGIEKATVTFGGTPEELRAVKIGEGNGILEKAACAKRTVTWKIGEYVKNEIIGVGQTPSYGGAAVSPYDVEGKYLPFVGWNNGKRTFTASAALPKVTENVVYTAVFGNEDDRFVSGALNAKMNWSLDRCTGTLTISGSGAMPNFSSSDEKPWAEYIDLIYTVVVKAGVKSLGNTVFSKHNSMHTLIIEEGLKTLGGDCFAYCDELTDLYLPVSCIGVSQGACYSCPKLRNIHYAGTEEQWTKFSQRIGTNYNDALKDATGVDCEASAPTSGSFTVTFVDDEGDVIAKYEDVKWGDSLSAPTVPEKENKTFLGYDDTYFLVTDDMTIHALYEKNGPSPEERLAALSFAPGAFIVEVSLWALEDAA